MMGGRNRGYYLNSLRAWRDEMLSEQRRHIARLHRMKAMEHPDAQDQAALIKLKGDFIAKITEAEDAALA